MLDFRHRTHGGTLIGIVSTSKCGRTTGTDLTLSKPEKVKELKAAWDTWKAEKAKPTPECSCVRDVTKSLCLIIANVYLAKHRVSAAQKKEIARLELEISNSRPCSPGEQA